MIEAMACGCPVVAFRHGSVPEIVEDGVTGFVVDGIDEAVAACARLDRLDRAAVRAPFRAALDGPAHGRGLSCGLPAPD